MTGLNEEERTKITTSLRDAVKIHEWDFTDETTKELGMSITGIGRPVFIILEDHRFYIKFSLGKPECAETTLEICKKCEVKPSKGFIVLLLDDVNFGQNLFAYQCDHCLQVQLMSSNKPISFNMVI